MIEFRQRPLIGVGIMILVSAVTMTIFGVTLQGVSALPLRQLPNPVVVTGDLSEVSLISASIMDPDPLWRTPTYDDSGWPISYLAATLPGWGAVVGGDFIWGGPPGTDVGGNQYEIPTNPAPQYLFLRDNFCIPINADVASIQSSVLQMQVVASPGDASINYNGADIGSLAGSEDGFIYNVNLTAQVASVRRLGRNTLAINVRDDVSDARAAIAYHVEFDYHIDLDAITLNPQLQNPPSGDAYVDTPVTFSYGGTGAGGDAPHTFSWDFGDGSTTSTDPNPTIAYTAIGTYTVTLIMDDRFGCSSEPVSMQYIVVEQPTPTPTNTPTPTSTPTPTNTPQPANTSAPPSQPANTPIPPPTPTLVPTPTIPVLLPATGRSDNFASTRRTFVVGCALLLVCYLRFSRYFSNHS
ncbi:MAG: PKD domain-containing protein [Chloroflexi bacterium]|nr:PKD domain-containing protein [Chloroflexota bacterium]